MSGANGAFPGAALPGKHLILPPLLLACAAGAWGILWWWSASPYAGYLDHGSWLERGVLAEICRSIPAGAALLPAVLHAGAWVLMIAAMMLPTIAPLVALFRRVTAGRADARVLFGLIVGGYVCAWLAFGVAAHALDSALIAGARQIDGFAAHGWIVGAGIIAAAGLFQFSALKYRCLERCRTPYGFIVERWRGRTPARDALRIGFDHGLFCVGCCWALMLVMFAVGMGNLGWMLLLGIVMAAEKNAPWGRHLSTPLGVALLAWAAMIVVANS